MELPNLLWNSVDIQSWSSIVCTLWSFISPCGWWISTNCLELRITANRKVPWMELCAMDLHKSNDMELHNSISISPIMEAHNSITEIHKSSTWRSIMNYGDPWLITKLHDCVLPFWHAILQPVLTITMNKMRKNETQLMNEQKIDTSRYK